MRALVAAKPEDYDVEVRPTVIALPISEKPAQRIRRLCDVFSSPSKAHWLIRDVLEQNVIALLTGARGTYKSFVATHWAMSIAIEGNCVLIISGEGAGIDRRLRAWLKTYAPAVDAESIPAYIIEQRVDLNSAMDMDALCAEIDALGINPALIVVDTFSKNSGALDENSNSETKVFVGGIDQNLRRRYGATVLIVHHTGHGEGKRARGASALEADTDASYLVERLALSYTVSVSRERFKDSPEMPKLAYDAKIVDLGYVDEDEKPVTSLVLHPASAESIQSEQRGHVPRGLQQRKLLAALKKQQQAVDPDKTLVWTPTQLREIGRELGLSKQTAQDSAAALASFYLVPTIGGYRLRTKGEK